MVDVVLATDNLTVLGGPSRVSVDVDLGVAGKRGSVILANPGIPTGTTIGNVPIQIYDMVINILPGNQYLGLYQYLLVDGAPSWVYLLSLTNSNYANKEPRTFNNGSVAVSIPISDLVSYGISAGISIEDLSIQNNVEHTRPVASSIHNVTIATDEDDNATSLDFTIIASQLTSENDWELLDDDYAVNILINVI